MGYFEGFGVTIRQHRLFGGKRVTTNYSGGRTARRRVTTTIPRQTTIRRHQSLSVSMGVMCSIAMPMAWKSALDVNCKWSVSGEMHLRAWR